MTAGIEQIALKLVSSNNKIEDIVLTSHRTTMAARILEGKSATEAADLVALLFSLCGTAQQQAALYAFEEALGYVLSPAHKAARQLLLMGEGINEHVTRVLVDWAELSELAPLTKDVRNLRQILSYMKHLIFDQGQSDRIGGGPLAVKDDTLNEAIETLTHDIERSIFGMPASGFYALSRPEELDHWLAHQDTLPAQVLRQWQAQGVLDHDWPTPNSLHEQAGDDLMVAMDDAQADHFIAQPTWQDQPCQTGALVRQLSHPLIRQMTQGPRACFVAKLIDLAELLTHCKQGIEALTKDATLYRTKALYKGFGQVEAVRGHLCHRVWIDPENDTIQRYRILAPTEWNFHHDGILKNALVGVEAADAQKMTQIARIAVMALDPCVACHIEVEETA